MALALYRKYRPPTFGDVSGQDHIKITLQNELATGKIAHAYLFNGPRGTGKTTMARILAKAVNCENRKEGESEPCNECEACKTINDGASLDVVEIDAASNRGVDNVQNNIINYIRVRPSQNKYRVFIIDEVHMLTSFAFNALLKTLEEPPEYVIFILATTEVHKILPTIISRCQRFDFKKLDSAVIKKRLMDLSAKEGIKVEDAVLDLVIHYSEGCMRDAESLLSQILSLDAKEVSLEQAQLVLPRSDMAESFKLLEYIFQNRLEDALALLNNLVTQGLDVEQFYKEFVSLLRQLLMLKLKVATVVNLAMDDQKNMGKFLEFVSVNQLMKLINLFVTIPSQYKGTVIPQLPFEVALVSSVQALHETEERNISKKNDISEKPAGTELMNDKQDQEKENSNNVEENVETRFIASDEKVKPGENETLAEAVVETIQEENQISKEEELAKLEASLGVKEEIVKEMPKQANQVIQNANNEDVIINIDLLKDRWSEVRTVLKKDNISLASLVTVSAPRLSDGKLAMVFRYQFNFDHVNRNPEMQELIRKAISQVLGYNCAVVFQCDPAIILLDQEKYQGSYSSSSGDIVAPKNENSFFDILGVEQAG